MHTFRFQLFFLIVAFLFHLLPACQSDDDESNIQGDEDLEESASELTDPTVAFPRLKSENGQIVDEYGRVAWLRGANAGSRAKMPPFLPWEGSEPGEATFDEDIDRFYAFPEDWSMNVIRLTVFWEAIEPERGSYDEDELAKIERQIEAAAERGLYVFVDFHQDLYSRILGGSGAPAWALPDPNVEEIPQDSANWFMRYFTDPTISDAFEHFWTNQNDVQDAYVDMVLAVVERVADHPNLMGIDLMNEPAPGTNRLEDFQGWFAEELVPFYERIGKAIRDQWPHLIVLVESSSAEAGGVDAGVMPMPDIDNLIFAPHYYNSIQFVMGEYDGNIENIEEGLGKWAEIGKQLEVPILISEYGFRTTVEDRQKGNPAEYFNDHYDVMDNLQLHGTVWDHEVTDTYWNQKTAPSSTATGPSTKKARTPCLAPTRNSPRAIRLPTITT